MGRVFIATQKVAAALIDTGRNFGISDEGGLTPSHPLSPIRRRFRPIVVGSNPSI